MPRRKQAGADATRPTAHYGGAPIDDKRDVEDAVPYNALRLCIDGRKTLSLRSTEYHDIRSDLIKRIHAPKEKNNIGILVYNHFKNKSISIAGINSAR